jgi:hypothetical protein
MLVVDIQFTENMTCSAHSFTSLSPLLVPRPDIAMVPGQQSEGRHRSELEYLSRVHDIQGVQSILDLAHEFHSPGA